MRYTRRRALHRLDQRIPHVRRRGYLVQRLVGQNQIVTAACHQDDPRAHRLAADPDPVRQLPAVGLPHVILLWQVLVQPLLDEAKWPLGGRAFAGLLDRVPQPGDGPWRGLPASEEAAEVVQGLALVAGAVVAGFLGRRELFAQQVGQDVLVRLAGLRE